MSIVAEAKKLNYTPFMICTEFASIFDFQCVIDDYLAVAGKPYDGGLNDTIMISLLRSHGLLDRYFRIYYVRNKFLPYVNITSFFQGQEISINYDKYKLSIIAQTLSSNTELCDLHTEIERIIFGTIENAIFTENAFVTYLQRLRILE